MILFWKNRSKNDNKLHDYIYYGGSHFLVRRKMTRIEPYLGAPRWSLGKDGVNFKVVTRLPLVDGFSYFLTS